MGTGRRPVVSAHLIELRFCTAHAAGLRCPERPAGGAREEPLWGLAGACRVAPLSSSRCAAPEPHGAATRAYRGRQPAGECGAPAGPLPAAEALGLTRRFAVSPQMWAEVLLLPCRARLLPPLRLRHRAARAMRLQSPQFQALFTPGLRSVAGEGRPGGRCPRGAPCGGSGSLTGGRCCGPGRFCSSLFSSPCQNCLRRRTTS